MRHKRLMKAAIGVLAFGLATSCGRPRISDKADAPFGGDGDKLIALDLSTPRSEAPAGGGLFPQPASSTFAGLIAQLRKAKDNTEARGYFVEFGSARMNWAQVEELSRLGGKLRDAERPVYCHANDLGNASYWLAAAVCDQIWLSPAGGIDGVGIAGQSVYLRGLLDRFKVKAEFLHMGKYKSAAETLTHEQPSEASVEAMTAVLQSIRQSWQDGLRGVAPEARQQRDIARAMERGPWDPKGALEQGLIDHVGYESEAREALKKAASAESFIRPDGDQEQERAASDIAQLLRALGGGDQVLSPHVAVLPAAGGISMQSGGGLSSDGIAADRFIKLVKRLKEDESVKAVVLRLDSPGGSALASDLMWHELMQLREKKPLIASVGSMAASGGYYMACAAHTVVAEKTSIVGSIGVVGGKIMFGDALAEYGVNTYTFSASDEFGAKQRAAYLSPFIEWDDPTREKVRRQMASVYDLFIDRISQGRDMDKQKIEAVAQGRIWTGAQGKEHGLVDELGGLRRAIELAKEKAELPEDAPFSIEATVPSFLESLGLDDSADEATVRAALLEASRVRPLWAHLAPGVNWLDHTLTEEQRAHLQSLAPLLSGDSVVVAMPFAFSAQ